MTGDEIIKVDRLTARIDNEIILSDISFSASAGDVTVILGSSGSGKTTLLKHLLGLYPSDKNTISVLGKNPSHLSQNEEKAFYSRLGVLYQNGALLNSLTVGENLALPLQQHTDINGGLVEKAVRLKLQMVNMQEAYNKYPSQLSGGMLKRAALARAIIMDPQILFCDEPGAGLDPVSLSALDELILHLQKLLGMTVVMVTHEVPSIMRTADKIVFLRKGKLVYEGTVQNGLESGADYLSEFFERGKGK